MLVSVLYVILVFYVKAHFLSLELCTSENVNCLLRLKLDDNECITRGGCRFDFGFTVSIVCYLVTEKRNLVQKLTSIRLLQIRGCI